MNDGPPKPMRATWAGDESDINQTPKRKPPQRRITVVGMHGTEDQQQESGALNYYSVLYSYNG